MPLAAANSPISSGAIHTDRRGEVHIVPGHNIRARNAIECDQERHHHVLRQDRTHQGRRTYTEAQDLCVQEQADRSLEG